MSLFAEAFAFISFILIAVVRALGNDHSCAASLASLPHERQLLQSQTSSGPSVAHAFSDSPLELDRERLLCYLKKRIAVSIEPSNFVELASFSSCAVVSSSGALLAHHFGEEIDSHTAVIRFNDAPIKSFEQHVGSKDTVRVISHTGFDRFKAQLNNESLFVWMDEAPLSAELVALALPGHVFRLDSGMFKEMSEALQSLFSERWWDMGNDGQSFRPTTGAMGVLLALSLCNTTVTYDMTPSAASQNASFHYYGLHSKDIDLIKADDNTWHKTFEAEKELWARLSSTSADDVYRSGKSVISGFSSTACNRAGEPDRIALLKKQRS